MGRHSHNRLTAVAISAKKTPGYYLDGGGLYLQVSASGSKSWIFRYTLAKRAREMGLGALTVRSLSDARELARKYRLQLADGIDPLSARDIERQDALQGSENRRSFEECAVEYRDLHASGWKNKKHADQWINTLTTYAFPIFGSKDVSTVAKGDVLRALEPIWAVKPETASRVRQRIRAVLDWASARDYRVDHDPHMWDQVARSLPKTKDIKKAKHFAACPYSEVHLAVNKIRTASATETIRAAIEFTVLTAARSGEVRGARWDEFDIVGKRWIIPAARMKAGREHRVPLSAAAMQILLTRQKTSNASPLVFPSDRGKTFSDMAFTMLLRREGFNFTMHGFRSTFRDWSAEQTAFPREVCEAALSHTTKDATEAAYFRSDLFEKRREMMEAWAKFCAMK